MEEWIRTLAIRTKEYTPDNIYNADEMGIFFWCMPDKTLEFMTIVCLGGRQSKE